MAFLRHISGSQATEGMNRGNAGSGVCENMSCYEITKVTKYIVHSVLRKLKS